MFNMYVSTQELYLLKVILLCQMQRLHLDKAFKICLLNVEYKDQLAIFGHLKAILKPAYCHCITTSQLVVGET